MKCTCTLRELKEQRYTVDWIEFTLEFKTYKYWQESEIQEVLLENVTTSPKSVWIARGGTADAKLSTTLAFTSAAGVTQIGYTLDGVGITINTAISSTDAIVID